MATEALVIIDIQNDYFPGGKMEVEGSEAAAHNAAKLLAAFRAHNMPVVHVRHVSVRPGATFFLPGTPGTEIHECVKPREGETVIVKNYPNCFRETPLLSHLQYLGVTRLLVCGMMTHMCVDAGVRTAFDHGFECRVAADACATRGMTFGGLAIPAAHVHGAFLGALGQVYAGITTTGRALDTVAG